MLPSRRFAHIIVKGKANKVQTMSADSSSKDFKMDSNYNMLSNVMEPNDLQQQKEHQTMQPKDFSNVATYECSKILEHKKSVLEREERLLQKTKQIKESLLSKIKLDEERPQRIQEDDKENDKGKLKRKLERVLEREERLLQKIEQIKIEQIKESLLSKLKLVVEEKILENVEEELKRKLTKLVEERSQRIRENVVEEKLQRRECFGDSSSKYFNAAELDVAFEQLKRPIMCDDAVLQDSQLPAAKKICMLPPIRLLLELKNTACLGESILVGAVVHATSTSLLEFYFFNAKDMVVCVGVGLPRAKVIVHYDFSIIIEETSVSENYEHFLRRDISCPLIMEVQMEMPGTQPKLYEEQTQIGDTGLSRYGVGFEFGSLYVDETYDAAEVSWPLLYDMALFILTSDAVQCNETKGKSSAEGGSGSFQGNNQENNMARQLQEKRDSVFNRGNSQGGAGDGDEDGSGCNDSVLEEEDQYLPVVSKVTVYPLPKCDFVTTNVKPDGLNGASIAPKLVFQFRKNGAVRRISIEAQSHLQLGSDMDVFSDADLFGWYHTDIQISLGCEDRGGHGRVASLEQNSCRILNPKTSDKYTASKSITCTEATTYTAGGQVNLKLLGSGLQGSASGSGMKQEASSGGENIEMTRECVCEGFSFQNSSCAASPAHATFMLFYPLQNLNIWADREFLQGQGLFSTIEPAIAATWIPLNEDDTSPYFFKVQRSLKLQHIFTHSLRIEKQQYNLPFYVNHAMTHLRNARRSEAPLELFGNQQSVPDVLMIGSVH